MFYEQFNIPSLIENYIVDYTSYDYKGGKKTSYVMQVCMEKNYEKVLLPEIIP